MTHLVEDGVNSRDHVFAVNEDGRAFGSAERHVEDGPLFGVVDLRPPEHGINPRLQTRLPRKLCKKL
jgi:hypothetical protein